jgi:hypothetical protein
MKHQVERLLREFPSNPRACGHQLSALLKKDVVTVRGCITEYLCSGAEETTARYVIALLDRESNILDILLDTRLTSVAQAKEIAKLVKQMVPRLDVDLAKTLRTSKKEQSVRILRLLAEVADSNRTLPLLMRVVREMGPEARAQAGRILAQHCQNELFVEKTLCDPDASVRAGALDGVGLRTQKSSPAILKTAMSDHDPGVRTHALLAAFRLGDEEAAGRLRLLSQDQEPTLRALAAWAMGQTRHECFLEPVAKLERDPDGQVRTNAQEARQQIESQLNPPVEENQETSSDELRSEGTAPNGDFKIEVLRASFSEPGAALLHVGLTAPNGGLIPTLSQGDLSVEVDGRPAPNLEWTAPGGEYPLHAALVLEYSSNMPAPSIIEMQTAASAAIRAKRENDQFAFFKYSVEVDKTPFSPDSKRLGALVRRPFSGARRLSRLHDAVAEAARSLSTTAGQRVVIAVAEGADRGSELSLWKTIHLLNKSDACVFAVQYGQGGEQRTLRELSAASGGRYFHCSRGTELTHCLRDLITGLANCYRLGFTTDISPERDLRVRVRTSLGMAETTVPVGTALPAQDRKAS